MLSFSYFWLRLVQPPEPWKGASNVWSLLSIYRWSAKYKSEFSYMATLKVGVPCTDRQTLWLLHYKFWMMKSQTRVDFLNFYMRFYFFRFLTQPNYFLVEKSLLLIEHSSGIPITINHSQSLVLLAYIFVRKGEILTHRIASFN